MTFCAGGKLQSNWTIHKVEANSGPLAYNCQSPTSYTQICEGSGQKVLSLPEPSLRPAAAHQRNCRGEFQPASSAHYQSVASAKYTLAGNRSADDERKTLDLNQWQTV